MQFYKRKRKFEYYRKDYSNPFFRRREDIFAEKHSWQKKLMVYMLLLMAIASVWFAFFSRFLDMKNIEIKGLERASAADIETIVRAQAGRGRYLAGRQSNLLLFDRTALAASINEKFYFESVSIERRLPGTIELQIKEKQPKAVWYEDGRFFLIDEEGIVISEIGLFEANSEGSVIIENKGEAKIASRQTCFDKEKLDFTLGAALEIKKSQTALTADRFLIDNDIDTVKALVASSTIVMLNTKVPIANQIGKLMVLYKEELKSDFFTKSYIDLRHGDMIYYR